MSGRWKRISSRIIRRLLKRVSLDEREEARRLARARRKRARIRFDVFDEWR